MKAVACCVLWIGICCAVNAQTSDHASNSQIQSSITPPSFVDHGPMSAVIRSDRSVYFDGEKVNFILTVTNHSHLAIKYQFDTSQMYDIQVSNSAGDVVWTWSKNRVFGPLVTNLVLSPGQSRRFNVRWNQRGNNDTPVLPGDYNVVAALVPMSKPKISGGLISAQNSDPANLGLPTSDKLQTGAVVIRNATPPVYAKTNFTIQSGS